MVPPVKDIGRGPAQRTETPGFFRGLLVTGGFDGGLELGRAVVD